MAPREARSDHLTVPGTDALDRRPLGDFTTDARLLKLTVVAAVIGVAGAFVALALVRLIGFLTHVFYYHDFGGSLISPTANRLGGWAVPIPIVGGLIVGVMARYGTERIRGHGIPEALEAILIGQSRMTAKIAVLKPVSSAISIGTGGPFGAEGPIIMTGGAVGSLVAQAFRFSPAERKTLLVAGAAGGMAAVFATPVAAVLLAVELLLFEWKPRSLVPVAAAAAVAGALRVPLLGAGPMFPLPAHVSFPVSALGVALGVGLVAGFGSALLTWLVYACEDLFRKVPIHWMWWPALAGVVVGVGGLLYPRSLGVGYDTIRDLLTGQLAGGILLGLMLTKAIIWAVALGSGTSGGVLAPLLIIGGSLGALEAPLIHAGEPGVWAALSMGAMLGGTMRSPFTAVVFLLELTHDVTLLPALLVACVAADAVTVLLMKRSILTEKVARRGTHVMREYIVSPLHQLRVGDVMERDVATIPGSLPIDPLFRRLATVDPVLAPRQAWPIVDDGGKLVGIITRRDLARALQRDGTQTVLEAGTKAPLAVAFPDELLARATQRMLSRDIGRLPVVSRDDRTRLVGWLGRSGIVAAWKHMALQEDVQDEGWLHEIFERLGRRRGGARHAR